MKTTEEKCQSSADRHFRHLKIAWWQCTKTKSTLANDCLIQNDIWILPLPRTPLSLYGSVRRVPVSSIKHSPCRIQSLDRNTDQNGFLALLVVYSRNGLLMYSLTRVQLIAKSLTKSLFWRIWIVCNDIINTYISRITFNYFLYTINNIKKGKNLLLRLKIIKRIYNL